MTTKETQREKNTVKATLIAENERHISGDIKARVTYQLIEICVPENHYLISVKTSEENSLVFAGTDEENARKAFNLFCDGSVTPCVADDIARDILYSKKY